MNQIISDAYMTAIGDKYFKRNTVKCITTRRKTICGYKCFIKDNVVVHRSLVLIAKITIIPGSMTEQSANTR